MEKNKYEKLLEVYNRLLCDHEILLKEMNKHLTHYSKLYDRHLKLQSDQIILMTKYNGFLETINSGG